MESDNQALVIIPTYNEKENIVQIIEQILILEEGFHVLVVDDNSPDKTSQLVEEKIKTEDKRLFILHRKAKEGLGRAYISGFKWAMKKGYEYIFEMDADFSHNPKDLLRLLREARENHYDLVIGSRYLDNKISVINWPLGRVIMSFFASKYVKIILGMKIYDTTSGFKCFNRKVLERINLDKIMFSGYAFQIELHYRTYKLGFKIKEIPIIFKDRSKGVSKMSTAIFNEAFFGVIKLFFTKVN